jgi:hypothetical protein
MYILYTKLHRTTLQTTILDCSYSTLIAVLSFNWNFHQNDFEVEAIPTHYKYSQAPVSTDSVSAISVICGLLWAQKN